MAGAVLISNGVQLNNVKTLLFEQTSVLDPSGTDQERWDYRIAVEGIVVPSLSNAHRSDGTVGTYGILGATATDAMAATFNALRMNRKPLKYTMAGVTLMEVTAAMIPDADNGPKVTHCRIVSFTPNSYRVQFEVTFSLHHCGGSAIGVLNNRWSCADSVDDNWRTTRAWRGRLRMKNAANNPHSFRGVVVPPILKGWKRRSMNFTGEPNGLELTYEIIDEEMLGDAPPVGAISMSGTHMETLTMQATTTVSEVNLRLDGPPGTNKQLLVQQCLAVLDNRLNFANFLQAFSHADAGKAKGIFRSLVLMDMFGDSQCAVEARATVQRFASDQTPTATMGNMIFDKFATPLDMPNYDRQRAVAPSLYPASVANLFSVYLQTPCGEHSMPQGVPTPAQDQQPDEDEGTEQTYNPEQPTVTIPEPQYSEDHKEAVYMHCSVESEYLLDQNRLPLPKAVPPNFQGDTQVVVRVAAPTARRIVRLAVERIGTWPKIWAEKDFTDRNGIKHWILRGSYNLRPRDQTGDSTQLYVIDQELEFALGRAPRPDQMSAASLFWSADGPQTLPSEIAIDPEDQSDGL